VAIVLKVGFTAESFKPRDIVDINRYEERQQTETLLAWAFM
jgi:hypothetical protein